MTWKKFILSKFIPNKKSLIDNNDLSTKLAEEFTKGVDENDGAVEAVAEADPVVLPTNFSFLPNSLIMMRIL